MESKWVPTSFAYCRRTVPPRKCRAIQIGTVPIAQLGYGADSELIVINPGENTNIKVSLTGGPFWWVVYSKQPCRTS
jgi:hypothetical protein